MAGVSSADKAAAAVRMQQVLDELESGVDGQPDLDGVEGDNQSYHEDLRDCRALKVSAVGRVLAVTPKKEQLPVRLHACYINQQHGRARPTAMIREALVGLLPMPLQQLLPDFQVAWSYSQQLKPVAMNARAILSQPATVEQLANDLATHKCGCSAFAHKYMVEIQGPTVQQRAPLALGTHHVRTIDLDIVPHCSLRHLLGKGLNHIPLAPADTQAVVQANADITVQFMERVVAPAAAAAEVELQQDILAVMLAAAETWTRARVEGDTCGPLTAAAHVGVVGELTPDIAVALSDLKQRLLICEVDKAANTCCFMCPKYAQLLVLLRLEGSNDFEKVALTPHDISSRLRQHLVGIAPGLEALAESGNLPILRLAYKAHKQDYRFLTNASASMLSPVNGVAQSITSCIMQALQEYLGVLNKRVAAFTGASTQTCIVVQNSQQVVLNLPARIESDLCADITKCFENIPIGDEPDGLPKALRWAVNMAFQHVAGVRGQAQVLAMDPTRPPYQVTWQHIRSRAGSDSKVYLDRQQTLQLLAATIQNAYVTAAGATYRQTKGIPMGADYSPDACNLYFMSYEHNAVQRMCRLAADVECRKQLCREWRYCFRMMDDIRLVNAPTLAGFLKNPVAPGNVNSIGWIYPPCVGIDVTFDITTRGGGGSTQYLDMLTHVQGDGTYIIEMFDKQKKLPFEPVHFITLHSNRLEGSSYKLLLGQAYRITMICSTAELAAKHVAAVVRKLHSRGFKLGRLINILEAWATADPHLPGKTYSLVDMVRAVKRRRRSWSN